MSEDFLHLPLVSLTPVANLELQISPRIFEKIWNGPIGILRAWGKLIHEKNQKSKISWHCPSNLASPLTLASHTSPQTVTTHALTLNLSHPQPNPKTYPPTHHPKPYPPTPHPKP